MFHGDRAIFHVSDPVDTNISPRVYASFSVIIYIEVGDREIAGDRCTTTHENACKP